MIEIYNKSIKASAEEEFVVLMKVTDGGGKDIVSNLYFCIFDEENNELATVQGQYGVDEKGIWTFEIPVSAIKDLEGSFWYSVKLDNQEICFKSPLYLV